MHFSPRWFGLILAGGSLLLCQCATKHQPIRFSASYTRYPEELFSQNTVKECTALENKNELNLLEKKRLVDLYTIEAKHTKANSLRFFQLNEKAEKLRPEVEKLLAECDAIKSELFSKKDNGGDPAKAAFETPGLKRDYSQAYQFWNRDDNEIALTKVKAIVESPEYQKAANKWEWIKVLNMRFRIAHDLQNIDEITVAYTLLKEFDNCAPETANAGFLLALTHYIKGDFKSAMDTFKEQCDKDVSLSNKMRRAYWMFRFQETSDPLAAQEKYQELNSLALPGYYVYLAKSLKGDNFQLPPSDSNLTKQYLENELTVSGRIHEYLSIAEERLKVGLKKDATLFLLKVVGLLKEHPEENILPLLYTGHLFRAAGNHLESMKAFTMLMAGEKEPAPEWNPLLQTDFMEMFPRPFNEQVNWLSRLWNIDEDFIYSIMRQESAFNPGAISVADARGLMQLMPSLAKSLSQNWRYRPYSTDRVLFNADENLKLSTYHLHQLQLIAPHFALMAASYNAGINRTGMWWQKFGHYPLDVFVELIPVSETRNYVKLVLRNYIYYKAMKSNGTVLANTVSLKLPPYGIGKTKAVLP